MLVISEKAAEMVQLSASSSGSVGLPLRISARRGGKGDIIFNIGFDERKEGDVAWASREIPLVAAPESAELIKNTLLDFRELPQGGAQFTFITYADGEGEQGDRSERSDGEP